MSDKKQVERLVTPTGKITFIKNLFVSGGDKDRFSGALVLSSDQDTSKLRALMMNAAKEAGFTKDDVTSSKFSFGMKKVDIKDLDFCNEGDVIVNFDRNGSFGPPEVKGVNKGPDGKYEDLIDGDIKAGDYCRVLVSAFGWEYKGKKGVKLNFEAVQFIKEGEAFYSAPTSDSAWDDTTMDVEIPEAFSEGADQSQDADWADAGF